MANLKHTIVVTGVGGGIGSGWLRAHLKSPQALQYFTIYIIHPTAPGSLTSILGHESPAGHEYEVLELDLAHLKDVQKTAHEISGRIQKETLGRISLMLLIAGNMFLDPVAKDGVAFTDDGIEKTFAVNYLANVVLVHTLLPSMAGPAEGARIIVIGSSSHDPSFKSNTGAYHKPEMKTLFHGDLESLCRKDRLKVEKGDEFPAAVRRYGGSKFCLTMFMYETNRRFQQDPKTEHIRFLACDPGIVGGTRLTDSLPWYIRMVMQYVLVPIQTVSAWLWPAGGLRTTAVAGADLQWCCWDDSVRGGEYWDGRTRGTSSPESLEKAKWALLLEQTRKVINGLG